MISVGDPFPTFSLPNQDGVVVTSDEMKGTTTVYYFYPKDDTPGCTTEACEFRDSIAAQPGARVVGISPDGAKKHRKFADKFNLNFTLLADEEKTLIGALGLWVEKSLYGRTYMGVERSTFLVDSNGVIQKIWRKVKPEGHAQEVASALK